jgi:hypothetical protein
VVRPVWFVEAYGGGCELGHGDHGGHAHGSESEAKSLGIGPGFSKLVREQQSACRHSGGRLVHGCHAGEHVLALWSISPNRWRARASLAWRLFLG